MIACRMWLHAFAVAMMSTLVATAAGPLQTPEQFLGFKVGADNTRARYRNTSVIAWGWLKGHVSTSLQCALSFRRGGASTAGLSSEQ